MAATPTPAVTPVARADVDTVAHTQVTSLKTQAAAESQAVLTGSQSQWMMPEKSPGSEGPWSGSLFDVQGMEILFDRSQSNAWFDAATNDLTEPGTTGDLAITTLQIDMLAAMERAFRMRHTMRRPRSMCHAMGRKNGHGSDNGPLVQCILEPIRALVLKSKGTGPS